MSRRTFRLWERGTYVNTRLLRENGIGTMSNMNSAISAIRSMNTCELEAVSTAIDYRCENWSSRG